MTNEAVVLVVAAVVRGEAVDPSLKVSILSSLLSDMSDRTDYLSTHCRILIRAMRDIVLGKPNDSIEVVMLACEDAQMATLIHKELHGKDLNELADLAAQLVRTSLENDAIYEQALREAMGYMTSEGVIE